MSAPAAASAEMEQDSGRRTSILPGPNRTGIDVELAIKNLPDAELEALKAQLSPEEFAKYTPDEWKKQIVMNRISSAICHYCRSKGKTPLFYCDKCHCTFFCSGWCQQQDEQHSLWCCNPGAMLDSGPTQMVVEREKKQAELTDEQKAQLKKMQDITHNRQTLSTRWLIVQCQCRGDALLTERKYEEALAHYTAGTRKPSLTEQDRQLKIGSFYGRVKCFYGMELYHLALAEMHIMQSAFKMDISPECVHIRIRCMVKLCMFSDALKEFTKIMTAPCFNNNEFRIVQQLARSKPTDEQKAKIGKYNPCQRPLFKLFTPDDPVMQKTYIELVNRALMGEAQKDPFAVVKESPLHGLGLFSGADLEKGESIFADAADAVGSVSANHCENCTTPFRKKRVPCQRGCGAFFCSSECNGMAMNDFHKWQCDAEIQTNIAEYRVALMAQGQTMTSRMPMLLIRLLGKCGRGENVLETVPFLRAIKSGEQKGLVSLEQGMAEYKKLMIALRLRVEMFDYYTFDFLRMALLNNTFALGTSNKGVMPFALALYQSVSFINHSCVPNCAFAFDVKKSGNRIYLGALRPIKKGEEIVISYRPDDEDYESRTNFLSSRYGFECSCVLCKKDQLMQRLAAMTPAQRGKLFEQGKEVMRATKAGEAPESIMDVTNALLEERKYSKSISIPATFEQTDEGRLRYEQQLAAIKKELGER